MASLLKQPHGRKALQIARGGKRHTIRLGKVTLDQARQIKVWIERLTRAAASGIEDVEAVRWTDGIGDDLRGRLRSAGIIRHKSPGHTLGELVEQFYAGQRKGSTDAAYRQATSDLLAQWGEDRSVEAVTVLDAEKWRNTLTNRNYAAATVAKRVLIARNLFGCAVRWEWIGRNPFAAVKAGSQRNADRLHFIDEATAYTVMEACPDDTWRLIFALCRWGGLRCPSELAALRWSGVNWEKNRMSVHSPKTADQGKPLRVVPIFPEIHPHLLAVFNEAEPGEDRVFPRLGGATNLRTGLTRILQRAAVTPWPKLFQNLRATRETELAETHPIQVVCAWIGNTVDVARKHYLQVTDEHFDKALQKAVRPIGKMKQNEAKIEMAKSEKSPENTGRIGTFDISANGRGWIRPNPTVLKENTKTSGSAAKSDARDLATVTRAGRLSKGGEPDIEAAFEKVRRLVQGGGQ